MTIDLPRETALKILYEISEKGAYSNISLNKHLEAGRFTETDRAFVTELVYGAVKWRLKIDWVISRFSNIKLKKISPWILNILRLGTYQLLYMDRVPESAACNESAKLAKKYGHAGTAGLVGRRSGWRCARLLLLRSEPGLRRTTRWSGIPRVWFGQANL